MNVRKTIGRYIEGVSGDADFDHSSNLFEAGLLTSLDVLSLVSFIEDTFGLDLTVDDVDMDSFGTVDGLVALIDAKSNVDHAVDT
jgi:acyl carrier protein